MKALKTGSASHRAIFHWCGVFERVMLRVIYSSRVFKESHSKGGERLGEFNARTHRTQ